jgi:L-amino acid N-acyltransferase YncA
MTSADWSDVERIYLAGIATGHATFETTSPGWNKWDADHLADPRLVAVESDDRAVGWAAGSAVSEPCVYGGVIEHSVYVDPSWRARGIGRQLLEAFVGESERLGYWTIQSGIFPENEASLALHEQCGFRIVGRREKVGLHMGVWRDVILIERRSSVAGIN